MTVSVLQSKKILGDAVALVCRFAETSIRFKMTTMFLTTWKFRDMYAFGDETAKRRGLDLIVDANSEGLATGINPFTHGPAIQGTSC